MYARRDPEYYLVDRNLERVTSNPELQQRYIALLDQLIHSPEYRVVWQRGEYSLIQWLGAKS
jgi:hypothetical protein